MDRTKKKGSSAKGKLKRKGKAKVSKPTIVLCSICSARVSLKRIVHHHKRKHSYDGFEKRKIKICRKNALRGGPRSLDSSRMT